MDTLEGDGERNEWVAKFAIIVQYRENPGARTAKSVRVTVKGLFLGKRCWMYIYCIKCVLNVCSLRVKVLKGKERERCDREISKKEPGTRDSNVDSSRFRFFPSLHTASYFPSTFSHLFILISIFRYSYVFPFIPFLCIPSKNYLLDHCSSARFAWIFKKRRGRMQGGERKMILSIPFLSLSLILCETPWNVISKP